jgi:hypothetical protein
MGNSVPSGNFELEATAAAAAQINTTAQQILRVICTPQVSLGSLTTMEPEFFGTPNPKSLFPALSSVQGHHGTVPVVL